MGIAEFLLPLRNIYRRILLLFTDMKAQGALWLLSTLGLLAVAGTIGD
jgi:hypothetical protein